MSMASDGRSASGPDPAELLDVAVDTARAAADLVAARRTEGRADVVATKSTETDVVTAADREAERLIADRLRLARPQDSMLGEETGARAGDPGSVGGDGSAVRWLVDPIDGTVNYVYRLGYYAVSIAAEVDGEVVAGVVRNAASGDEWTATRGGGAWRDGRRLRGPAVTDLRGALVATGFGYDSARRAHQARVLADLLPEIRDIRRFGAASLDLCHAAEGLVDAFYEKGLNGWDHAAGGLIAAEAGLIVSGLRGAAPGAAMVLAAPPAIHAFLHDRLVELDADGGP
jgi:myo-inositol-1(or 4)-monophosphatase